MFDLDRVLNTVNNDIYLVRQWDIVNLGRGLLSLAKPFYRPSRNAILPCHVSLEVDGVLVELANKRCQGSRHSGILHPVLLVLVLPTIPPHHSTSLAQTTHMQNRETSCSDNHGERSTAKRQCRKFASLVAENAGHAREVDKPTQKMVEDPIFNATSARDGAVFGDSPVGSVIAEAPTVPETRVDANEPGVTSAFEWPYQSTASMEFLAFDLEDAVPPPDSISNTEMMHTYQGKVPLLSPTSDQYQDFPVFLRAAQALDHHHTGVVVVNQPSDSTQTFTVHSNSCSPTSLLFWRLNRSCMRLVAEKLRNYMQ